MQHNLHLSLGSSSTPTKGGPKADHFLPSGMRMSKSVPLESPGPQQPRKPGSTEMPELGEMPKPTGRLIIYWGCGASAPKGQPIIVDFSKVGAGQQAPAFPSSNVPVDPGPTERNSKTWGRWPFRDKQVVRPESSLIGAHRVAGNYTPEISFTLTKDFLGAVRVTSAAQPSGATLLSWNSVPDVTGFYASIMGGKRSPNSNEMGDIVMWVSSATRQFGGGLSEWLTPSQVSALVRDRTVLASATTACMVPKEVKRDSPDFMMGTLIAYGPTEEFSYPPRPSDPKVAWNLEWTARIRHRSKHTWVDGSSMGQGESEEESECRRTRRGRGLGGLLGGAIGVPSGC